METLGISEKYLPIGSVVILKGAKKRLMITGFCVIPHEFQDKLFDYCGCLYPEGVVTSEQIALFNHDQIAEVFFEGFSDDEEKDFKQRLKEELYRQDNNG